MKNRPNVSTVMDNVRKGYTVDSTLYHTAEMETKKAIDKVKKVYGFHHAFEWLTGTVCYIHNHLDSLEKEGKINGCNVFRTLEALSMNLDHGLNNPYQSERAENVAYSAKKLFDRIQKTSERLADEGFHRSSSREVESQETKQFLRSNLRMLLLQTAQLMHDYTNTETPKVNYFQKENVA